MSKPHKCPVCEGRQTVPAAFYADGWTQGGWRECRTCEGSGVLWSLPEGWEPDDDDEGEHEPGVRVPLPDAWRVSGVRINEVSVPFVQTADIVDPPFTVTWASTAPNRL